MKIFLLIVFVFSIIGCDLKQEVLALQSGLNEEKVWVFVQFNVREESDGLESYYYYGEISKDIYNQIRNNSINKGFVLLENVKYWGDEDLIYNYADVENFGELIFRIEDISKVVLINVEPIAGKGVEQFDLKPEQATEKVDDTKSSNEPIKQD